MSIKANPETFQILKSMCENWSKRMCVCFLKHDEKSYKFFEEWKKQSKKRHDHCWVHVNCDKYPIFAKYFDLTEYPTIIVFEGKTMRKFKHSDIFTTPPAPRSRVKTFRTRFLSNEQELKAAQNMDDSVVLYTRSEVPIEFTKARLSSANLINGL